MPKPRVHPLPETGLVQKQVNLRPAVLKRLQRMRLRNGNLSESDLIRLAIRIGFNPRHPPKRYQKNMRWQFSRKCFQIAPDDDALLREMAYKYRMPEGDILSRLLHRLDQWQSRPRLVANEAALEERRQAAIQAQKEEEQNRPPPPDPDQEVGHPIPRDMPTLLAFLEGGGSVTNRSNKPRKPKEQEQDQ